MDMLEGVGRRSGTEKLFDLGQNTLNGYERNGLFRNNGDGTFTDVGWLNAADRDEDGRGVALLDFNHDGRLDLAMRNYRQPAVLLKNVGAEGNFVSFKLQGTTSNRDAVGARIRLRTGDDWQTRVVSLGTGYLSGSSLHQHFGVGEATRLDEVTIEWPSGKMSRIGPLEANRRYHVLEPEGDEDVGPVVSILESPARRESAPDATRLGDVDVNAARGAVPEG